MHDKLPDYNTEDNLPIALLYAERNIRSIIQQAESGAGLEAQREAIHAEAARRNWSLVAVFEDIASVTVRSAVYHEYVQLVRTSDGWKIANTLWQLR